ncbi:L,D-transpeptidase [Caballeronia insecticola]|uniref:ErfK/YbiS/YcfS/YnhG family protein n=1 Tax=Caballeronia insecticola TaxID=758793 RepID=R4WQU3_9BURK|nr:L,D-transpeptidase [Caballeronia insecticola]BAN26974.1 ErfK/YbiS/YcfS/YnhG family protein [Caballeronia insecticola]
MNTLPPPVIDISIRTQTLTLTLPGGRSRTFPVSTALNGPGSAAGSGCTPLGLHRVRLKIGGGAPAGAVFVGRRATGEIHRADASAREPERDWILSRILWLQGMEPGRNRGGNVDTLRRFVYIHGTAAEADIGTACSHGCIRMNNADVIELFDLVPPGCAVRIHRE